ncbi:MAG: hypothetical protein AAFX99_16865, partial [Myxococcota bacterium]
MVIHRLDDLYTLVYNKQGNPCGLRRESQEIARLARATAPVELLEALSVDDDLLSLLGALHMAAHHAHMRPADRQALYQALMSCLGDERVHVWSWGEASYQSKRFEVATLAAESAVRILEHDVRSHRRGTWFSARHQAKTPPTTAIPNIAAQLDELLERSLQNLNGSGPVRTILGSFRQLAYNREDKHTIAEQLADRFARVACARDRVAALREQAIEELERAIRTNPLGTRETFEAARARIVDTLVAAIADPTEDFRFHRRARPLLMQMAPTTIEALQESGALEIVPLPPAAELLNGWGMPSDERSREVAHLVTVKTVVEALHSDDPEAIISAACVAPLMGHQAPWRELGRLLVQAINHPGHIEQHDPRGRVHTVRSGAIAAERLLKLLAPHIRQEQPEAAQLFLAGLDQLLNGAPSKGGVALEPVRRYLREIRWLRGSLQSALQDRLMACARDTTRAPSTRFAALLADRRPEANTYAWTLLTSSDAPLELRALIGSHIHQWCPEELSSQVEMNDNTWTLKPNAHDTLPISEPGRKVPLPWLVAALRMSEHRYVTFAAVRSLGTRFSRTSETPQAAKQRERLLRWLDPSLLEVLRGIL